MKKTIMKVLKNSSRQVHNLMQVGLVIAGLLAGILATLWLTNDPNSDWQRPMSVESVELGNSSHSSIRSDVGEAEFRVIDIESINTVFKEVASSVTPSVVFIEVESRTAEEGRFSNFGTWGVTKSVGSGVIISAQGFVVTNNHVIANASKISVTLSDKREFQAELVGKDNDTDLAVLRLRSETPFKSIPLGNSDELQVGEWVLAIGNPFRLTSTVTAGIISALGREVHVIEDKFGIENFIQTDAAINPGNSGGALVNLRGELIGIATAIATESGTYQGYGFAVPVNLMERVVRDLIQFGEVQRGFLGVTIAPIDAARARELGLKEIRGVYLNSVQKGLAASTAGLAVGDVLLSINGKTIFAPNELQSVVALHRPGESIIIDVWRDGNVTPISVELSGKDSPQYRSWISAQNGSSEERGGNHLDIAPPQLQIINLADWGVGLANLSERYKNRFGVDHGVYIAYVEQNGIFSKAGIPRNVLLMEMDTIRIVTVEDAETLLQKRKNNSTPSLLKVRRSDGIMMFFEIMWPEK